MQLNKLTRSLASKSYNLKDVAVKSLEFDSRKVKSGALFIALAGDKFDGHNFVKEAMRKGAVALVTQRKIATSLPQIVVRDTRATMAKLAKRFYGDFGNLLRVGITGTNGKTTTAFLIHSILREAGKKPGLIGTIYYWGKAKIKADRTTPESLDVFKLFDQFRSDEAKSIVMEISSHALSLKRVDEIRFDAAVFTNLSQDHLDFHKTLAGYVKAKLHIFDLLEPDGYAIFNMDDPVSKAIKALRLENTITYGTHRASDLHARILADDLTGTKLEVFYKNKKYHVRSPLIGSFNIYNILAAFATGIALDIDCATIIKGLEKLRSIRGRMERISENVLVDFGHTPAAIESALKSLRHYTKGKLIIVFGCGGDRDQSKRPKMGALASKLADLVVITSDNPRSESPNMIIEAIVKGIKKRNFKIIEDRAEAISYTMHKRNKDDIVLIAGKGHEEYQLVGNRKIDFNDAEVVRKCITNC